MADGARAFSERLNLRLDQLEWPVRGRAAELGRRTGRTATAAGKWINGQSIPEHDIIRLLSTLLDVSPAWLEYGTGPMEASPVRYADAVDELGEAYAAIPWGESAEAGQDAMLEPMTVSRQDLERLGVTPDECIAMICRAENLAPEIRGGDRMLLKESVDEFIDGEIYLFRIGNDERVKYVTLNVDGSIVIRDTLTAPGERVAREDIPALTVLGWVLTWTRARRVSARA